MLYETAVSSDQAIAGPGAMPDEAPATTLGSLFRRQCPEDIEAGAALLWQGEKADHAFLVVKGVFRIVRILCDGRRGITGFLYPGDLIGAALRDRYPYTVEAVTDARVRRIGRPRFDAEIDNRPGLRPELMSRMCDELAAAQEQMVMLARKTAEERVCSFLRWTARRVDACCPDALKVAIPMTRLDIADHLGLTIETVSRIMSRLMARGVIAAAGRHAVAVRDADELARLAGDGDEGADNEPAHARARTH